MNDLEKERLILVVQDDAAHLSRIEAALQESEVRHRTITITNGTDALDFLHRHERHPLHPRDLLTRSTRLPTLSAQTVYYTGVVRGDRVGA